VLVIRVIVIVSNSNEWGKSVFVKKILVAFIFLSLTACTIPRVDNDYSVSKKNNTGVIAYANEILTLESTAYLRKVDLKNKKFVGEPIKFSTCTGCIPYANTFKFENTHFPKFFSMELEAGTYAFLGAWQSTYVFYNFCRGTPIFEIKPGEISVVFQDLSEYPNEAATNMLKTAVQTFPNMKSEVSSGHTDFVAIYDHVNEKGDACPWPHGATTFKTMSLSDFKAKKSTNILN